MQFNNVLLIEMNAVACTQHQITKFTVEQACAFLIIKLTHTTKHNYRHLLICQSGSKLQAESVLADKSESQVLMLKLVLTENQKSSTLLH
jgi:hypothetical protein